MAAKEEVSETGENQIYYVLGAMVLVAVVAAGWILRSKTNLPPPVTVTPVGPSPTPGPITTLVCEKQYYNPVIGFPRYYLTLEGGDVSPAAKVDCTFTVSVSGKIVATESAASPLTPAPQRGGATFRCTTKAVDLPPTVPTKIDYLLKDDLGKLASCSSTFSLPKP